MIVCSLSLFAVVEAAVSSSSCKVSPTAVDMSDSRVSGCFAERLSYLTFFFESIDSEERVLIISSHHCNRIFCRLFCNHPILPQTSALLGREYSKNCSDDL